MFRLDILSRAVVAVCVVVLLSIAVTENATSQTWSSLNGPQVAKNVKNVTADNSATPIVYAADNTYVLKSTNGGIAWRATPTTISAPLVLLCKPDANAMVTTGRANFFTNSIDGGSTWNDFVAPLTTSLTPLRLSGSPITPAQMYLGRNWYDVTNVSLYRSTNGGGGWIPATNFSFRTDVHDVAPYPIADGTRNQWVWAAGTAPVGQSERGLFYSADAGVTWSSVAGASGYDIKSAAVIHKPSPALPHLLVAKSNGDILKSTDFGATWSCVLSTGFLANTIRTNSSNNYIYLATENGMYRSTDEGGAWNSMNSGLGNDLVVQSLAINTSGTLFAGTIGSMYKSTDNGSSWKNVGVMNVSSVVSNGTNTWAVTKDNSFVAPYTSSTNSWGTNSYVGSASADFSSEQIYRNPHNSNIFVSGALSGTAKLYRSTNGGTNFTLITTPVTSGGKYNGAIAHPTVTTQMYLFGGGTVGSSWKSVFSSADGGATWNATSPPWDATGIYVNDLVALNVGSGRLFAALSNGKVYKSDDNGASWSEVLNIGTGATAYSVGVNTNVTTTVYAATNIGIFKSTNSGISGSWSNIGGGSSKRVIVMAPGSPTALNHVIILSTDGTAINYSFNGGTSWYVGTGNLPTPINDIRSEASSASVVYAATVQGVYSIAKPTTAPTLLSPASQSTQDINVALTWSSIANAAYHVMVDDASGFGSPNIDLLNYSGTSFTNYNLTINNTYYWKVAASNLAGEIFSSDRNFQTDTTGTISLSMKAPIGGHPMLLWTSAGGDNGPLYNVFRYSCSYPGSDCGVEPYQLIWQTTDLSYTDNSVTVVSQTTANTQYFYQVRRSAISNKRSVFSNLQQKTVRQQEIAEELPRETKLEANYPNPFNPATDIKYSLSEDTHVKLVVYDVVGRIVATLVDETQPAGYRSVRFDAASLPSGVYYYRLSAGSFTQVRKMMLLK